MDGNRVKGIPVLAVAAAVMAGCGAGATPTAGPPTPSPAATRAPSPGPTENSGRVLFSGTLDCGFPDGLEETTEGAITTYTGTIECTYAASDPRASGTEAGLITMVELDQPGYHVNKWFSRTESKPGTNAGVITNAGGSWRNTEVFGADVWDATGHPRTSGTAAYVGEGGYAGLRMRLLYAQGTSEPVNGYILVGWIEPAG